MPMLSPTLTELYLFNIPSLVELPSSFRNLNKLRDLKISRCTNLETLPTGINLKSLKSLDLTKCSRLMTFLNISTNISVLNLSYTAIEEVPWWVEIFSKLKNLNMECCSKLEYVHPNISKLQRLDVNFSHCEALNKADLSNRTSSSELITEASNSDTVRTWSSGLITEAYNPPENELADPESLPHVCKAGKDDMFRDECHKTELGEECGGSDVEIEHNEKCGGSDAEMKGSNKTVQVCIKDETECGDNIVERTESRKGMGMITLGRLLFKKLLNRYATKPQDT